MAANCFSRDELVDNAAKCFANLNSIFSLERDDKMNTMLNIGRGEKRRIFTRRFLKGRTMLGAKSADGTGMYSRRVRDFMSRFARIKKMKNMLS